MRTGMESELIEALKKIIAYEEQKVKEYETNPIYEGLPHTPFWDTQDVGIPWHIVNKLNISGYLNVIGGRRKSYYLKDREKVKGEIERYETISKEEPAPSTPLEIPSDLFDVIEGYDDLKKVVLRSIQSDEPVHILFVGIPGTAKSLFLQEIERIGGYFVTMGTTSKVGLRDIIFDETPRYLIIDEIDKLTNRKDISALLTWMESGRIKIDLHEKHEERRGKGWVFGACNTTKSLPPELLDRFMVFHLRRYEPEQFVRIVKNYLVKRVGIMPKLAGYIANRVVTYTTSVREAIRIARIAKNEKEVDEIISVLQRYRGETK